MARKRFTDADKWEDAWFCEQTQEVKLFWIYLCDRCDHAGVWAVNWRLAGFHLGDINIPAIIRALDGRIVELAGGRKWFIPGFIRFQYGSMLKTEVRPQMAVIRSLRQNDVDLEDHGIEIVGQEVAKATPASRTELSDKRKALVRERCGNKCSYCGVSGDEAEMTIDHITPISKGGRNDIDNLNLACRSCNSKKNNSLNFSPKGIDTLKDKDKEQDKDQDSVSGDPRGADLFAVPPAAVTHPRPGALARSFSDWLMMHGRVFVGRDDRADWEALYRHAGWEPMSQAHAAILPTLQPNKSMFFTQVRDYIVSHFEEVPDGSSPQG